MLNSGPVWVRMPHVLIGAGTLENNIAGLARTLGGKKVLIITDQGVAQAGLVDKVKQPLAKEGIRFGIFDGCQPDSPVSVTKSCAKFAKDGGFDAIISIGGGSTLDTGKVAGILATAGDVDREDVAQYAIKGVPRHRLPRIQIATTAGTGSEVSLWAIFTDTDGSKKSIASPLLLPEVAIIDPLMTLNLPARITADTGIDALSHAIEGYCNVNASVASDMFAEPMIKLIADNLRTAYFQGSRNLEARHNMAVAAANALLAITITGGATICHSMGMSFQTEVHCTHGLSLSILLPYVMEFNVLSNPARYARVAELMGENIAGMTLRDAALKSVDAIKKLTLDLDMPQRLRDIGVKKEQIPGFVSTLFSTFGRSLSNNPRDCSKEDAKRIFEAAW